MADFSSFDSIADDMEKAPVRPKYASDGLKALPDGVYEAEVTAGVMKEGEYGPVFTILMIVVSEGPQHGWKIEKTVFLTKNKEGGGRDKDEKRMGELKEDLTTMGFDPQNWTNANGRPFPIQLRIACEVMKGVRIKVKKKKNDEYHNLYIQKRLDTDGKPATFGPAEMVVTGDPFGPTDSTPTQPATPAPTQPVVAAVDPSKTPW